MPGNLNIFQRVMLQWNDLHPYNAVHVVRLHGPPDLARLRQAIETSLTNRGLSVVTLDREHATYEYHSGGLPVEIRTSAETDTDEVELTAQIEREINTPFRIDTPLRPFRFFVVPEGDRFALGTCYFHPIADAESMVMLIRGILAAYLGDHGSGPSRSMDCYPARHDRLLISRPGLVARKLLALPSDIRRMRHSFRARLCDANDLENRFRFVAAGGDVLRTLQASAKTWEVTLHDLLLALLMKALSPLAPNRTRAHRRRDISLGSIVNIRNECGIDRERTFGLFLGAFVVSHPVPDGIPLRALAMDIRRQTRRIKQHKLFLAAPLELAFAGRLFAFYSTQRRKLFYHRYHPLWGGISNMSLDTRWPPDDPARPLDYFRAVSTGPITPLVLTTTTYDDRMVLGITYRPTAFAPARITRFQEQFRAELTNMEDGR